MKSKCETQEAIYNISWKSETGEKLSLALESVAEMGNQSLVIAYQDGHRLKFENRTTTLSDLLLIKRKCPELFQVASNGTTNVFTSNYELEFLLPLLLHVVDPEASSMIPVLQIEVNGDEWENFGGRIFVPSSSYVPDLIAQPWVTVAKHSEGGMTSGSVGSFVGELNSEVFIIIDELDDGEYRISVNPASSVSEYICAWATTGAFVQEFEPVSTLEGNGSLLNALAWLLTTGESQVELFGLLVEVEGARPVDEQYLSSDLDVAIWTIELNLMDETKRASLLGAIRQHAPRSPIANEQVDLSLFDFEDE